MSESVLVKSAHLRTYHFLCWFHPDFLWRWHAEFRLCFLANNCIMVSLWLLLWFDVVFKEGQKSFFTSFSTNLMMLCRLLLLLLTHAKFSRFTFNLQISWNWLWILHLSRNAWVSLHYCLVLISLQLPWLWFPKIANILWRCRRRSPTLHTVIQVVQILQRNDVVH